MRYLLILAMLFSTPLWAESLLGQWQGELNGQPLNLQLNADNSGVLDGNNIQYATQGSMLMIQTISGLMAYSFSLKNGQLLVQGGDLAAPLSLHRMTANSAKTKAGIPTKQRTDSINPALLVGKWCLVTSFSANAGGGSYSSKCFILETSGRYSYQSERSMDAYGGGMWGGTNSQSGDAGRWTASKESITAISDSGQTNRYRMELRNHPKNNDPMICLEGDCYVSYYQESPW